MMSQIASRHTRRHTCCLHLQWNFTVDNRTNM